MLENDKTMAVSYTHLKKETRKKRAKKAETEIPENKNTVSQKEIKPEAQMEEVVPEVQDLSLIHI